MSCHVASEVIEAYEDWWSGKNTEPLIYYSYPEHSNREKNSDTVEWLKQNGGVNGALAKAVDCILKTGSREYLDEMVEHLEISLDFEGYALEGFSTFWLNFGPGSLAGNISGYANFTNGTTWFELEQDCMSYETIGDLADSVRTPYADAVSETVQKIAERIGGRTVLSQLDIGGPHDILASLRGSQNMLMDYFDQPATTIHSACQKIESIWCNYEKEYDSIIAPVNSGLRTSWITLLSTKPWYPLQCDLSAMVSPDIFEEFIKPSLERQAALYEHCVYHHDGDGQIPHTGFFADIAQITAMQWVPIPPGKINDRCWFDLYRQYIDMGKKVILRNWPLEDTDGLKQLFAKLPKEAFWLSVHGPDENSAHEFVRAI